MSVSVRPARLRSWLLAIAASFLVFALPAGAQAAAPTTVAVGDEHLGSARAQVLERFSDAGWPSAVFQGENGYRFDQLRPYLKYISAFTPGLQRVFLYGGRADAWRYSQGRSGLMAPWNISTSKGHLSGAVQDIRSRKPFACIFLTTVFKTSAGADPYYHYAAGELNQHMFEIERKYSNVFVIDWNSLQRGKGWLTANWPYLHPTNYYLTPSGKQALADLYRFFGSGPSGCGTRPQPG